MPTVQQTHKSTYILYDEKLLENAEVIDFDAAGPSLAAAGRGTVRVLHVGDMLLVLRHYHRGGLMAPVLGDRYCRTGLSHTRAWREWHMLFDMYRHGLPVPQPLAARVQFDLFSYRADIVTRMIPQAQTLAEQLSDPEAESPDWRAIGMMLQKFHSNGIFHADLNAHNLVSDAEKNWYLIDFDRGRKRTLAVRWQLANLKRLHHSLHKLHQTRPDFRFAETDWANLMTGYRRS